MSNSYLSSFPNENINKLWSGMYRVKILKVNSNKMAFYAWKNCILSVTIFDLKKYWEGYEPTEKNLYYRFILYCFIIYCC